MAVSEKELKSLLMKEESEKVGLKLNTQKTKIMASGPITSWQTDGETVADFTFGGSKITADGDCSHEITQELISAGLVDGRDLVIGNYFVLCPCALVSLPISLGYRKSGLDSTE